MRRLMRQQGQVCPFFILTMTGLGTLPLTYNLLKPSKGASAPPARRPPAHGVQNSRAPRPASRPTSNRPSTTSFKRRRPSNGGGSGASSASSPRSSATPSWATWCTSSSSLSASCLRSGTPTRSWASGGYGLLNHVSACCDAPTNASPSPPPKRPSRSSTADSHYSSTRTR